MRLRRLQTSLVHITFRCLENHFYRFAPQSSLSLVVLISLWYYHFHLAAAAFASLPSTPIASCYYHVDILLSSSESATSSNSSRQYSSSEESKASLRFHDRTDAFVTTRWRLAGLHHWRFQQRRKSPNATIDSRLRYQEEANELPPNRETLNESPRPQNWQTLIHMFTSSHSERNHRRKALKAFAMIAIPWPYDQCLSLGARVKNMSTVCLPRALQQIVARDLFLAWDLSQW